MTRQNLVRVEAIGLVLLGLAWGSGGALAQERHGTLGFEPGRAPVAAGMAPQARGAEFLLLAQQRGEVRDRDGARDRDGGREEDGNRDRDRDRDRDQDRNKDEDKDKITVTLTAPANGALYTAPANVALVAAATGKQKNHPIVKVEFIVGATLIGTVPGPQAGGQYTFNWTNAAAGTYTLTAKATNDKGDSDRSNAVTIKVIAPPTVNAPPTVSLSAPANGALFIAPATITLSANATDADGTIAKVDFFDRTVLVGTAPASPYGVTLTNVAPGSHNFTARATDNNGAATTSGVVSVIVNVAPTVTITDPVDNSIFLYPASFTLAATASDADGTVTQVDFYDDSTFLGTATSAPYTFTFSNTEVGSHVFTAKASDNAGAVTTSNAVHITVIVQLVLLPSSLPDATAQIAYSQQLTASGGVSPYTWTIVSGSLPNGLSLNSSTGVISGTPSTTGVGSFTVRVSDSGGRIIEKALSISVTGVALSISAPLSGASLDENITLVTGNYFGPFNTGITVNGQLACTDGQQFFVNNLPLVVGSNTITATATTVSGQKATQSIGVSSAGPFKINISVTPPCGAIAPLTAKFSLANNSGKSIATIQADYDGDGTWDVVTSDPKATLQFVYTLAGTYRAHFRITDSQGTAYDNTVLVLVSSQSGMNATHQTIWQGVTSNLAVGNIELALTYFAPEIRDGYRTVLNNIASALPGMFSNFPPISPTRISGDDAEYFVVLPQGGVDYGFYIYFGRGSDGIWRVQGL